MDYPGISVETSVDAKARIHLNPETKQIETDGQVFDKSVVYTGPIDELFECVYGKLPYRSLRFEWKTEEKRAFKKHRLSRIHRKKVIHELRSIQSFRYRMQGKKQHMR